MRPHALLLLSALASCAAPREAAPPSITPIDTFGVEYTAHITRTGLAPPRQADACAAPAEGATSPTEQIEFACEVFELDSERLARLLGQELGGERGRFLAETEAEILAEHLRSEPRLGSVLMFPRVLTNSGQTGEVMTSEQTAFVSGYELTEDT
ncbi:MAG: hypothetical protein QF410_09735, partial [Planctomycetota bacterium]|nr:hypothetical protein [Planctomycetota bacterium]